MTASTPELRIDTHGDVPPFEQLRTQLARQAADGSLPAGTKLPTVRGLAEALGLAPGTVARAYKELESDGVIETLGRRGTFVRSAATAGGTVTAAVTTLVAAARRDGLTLPETQRLVERSWS